MAFCTNCGTTLEDSIKFCPACGNAYTETKNEKPRKKGIKKSLLLGLAGGLIVILAAVLIFAICGFGNKSITQEQAAENHFRLLYSTESTLRAAKKDVADRLDQYLPPVILENMSSSERTDFVEFLFEALMSEDEDIISLNESYDGEFSIEKTENSEGIVFASVKNPFGENQTVRLIQIEEDWFPLIPLMAYYMQFEQ